MKKKDFRPAGILKLATGPEKMLILVSESWKNNLVSTLVAMHLLNLATHYIILLLHFPQGILAG